MLNFRAIGDWGRGRVGVSSTDRSSRVILPNVEKTIDETWARVASRPGVHLFDGPMCRLEAFEASPDFLSLTVSPTRYKHFVGTNLHNAHLADAYGRDVLANPVGVSTLLETADAHFMLGRRSAVVAYYPNRVHPFAGSLEPADGADPFAASHRELREELAIENQDVTGTTCLGIVEDRTIRQPELIFFARTGLAMEQVSRQVDQAEHDSSWAIQATEPQVEQAVAEGALTPVAKAALLLAGRLRFGGSWFERLHRDVVTPGNPRG